MINPFMQDVDTYKRDLNLRLGVVEQIAKYTALRLNKPYEEILPLVKAEISKNPRMRVRDRPMDYLQRVKVGHREKRPISFLKYLDLAISTGRIISPSMTIYQTAEEEKSVTADWLDENISLRKRSKNEMLRLGQIGDIIGSQLADYDQNAKKIRINSVSGMRGFKGCALFIQTGHSSLTTLCRAAAGYGNATVERFLGGARHYHTAEIAKANLVAILTIEDIDRWVAVMNKYQIVYPTVDQTFAMVRRSCDPYWHSVEDDDIIRQILTAMTPLERAVVTYSGDMYHFAIYNPELAKRFITDMIVLNPPAGEVDTTAELKTMSGTDKAYIFALASDVTKGTTLDLLKQEDPAGFALVGNTALAVKRTLTDYSDLISVLFVPKHLPPTVGNIRDISRTTGIIADTDSTIFTTQWWVEWMTGAMNRGVVEDRIWYMATFAVCQCIAHSLAMLSANVGVERKYITRLAMKNEYGFPVLMNTNLSKTYAALVSIREGNVFSEYDLDLKGVGLRGSSAPKPILQGIKSLIEDTLHAIDRGELLSAKEMIKRVAQYELDVMRSIKRGEYTYLRSDQIKPESTKMPYFELWQDVFGPKYGMSVEPPIPVVKVSLDITSKSGLAEWLESIEDKPLAGRLDTWLKKYNRKDMKTMYLPYQVIRNCGMPVEIADAANLKKVTYDTCSGFYLVLEACGLFIVDRNYHRLAYEFLGLTP